MCVIAYAPKGVAIPTEQQLEEMWRANPDGAGYAYEGKDHKIIYRKGFMTLEALKKELKDRDRFKNTNFAIHFRIGTSGKNDKYTCHPFPLSTNFGDLRKTEGEVDAILFHNGILDEGKLANPMSSDTQDFVIAMAPLLKKYNKSKVRDHFINDFTSGNRLLILYPNNHVKMYGEWQKDGDLFVSNLNYKNYYGYTTYATDYPYNYNEWFDRWCDKQQIKRPEKKEKPTDEEVDEADKLWVYLLCHDYRLVSQKELDLLKKTSDDYTTSTMEYGGMLFDYDEDSLVVYLAEDQERM